MTIDELISSLDQIEKDGPGAETPDGQTADDLMYEAEPDSEGLRTLVSRYASSSNRTLPAVLAGHLMIRQGDSPDPTISDLVYQIIEGASELWADQYVGHNCLNAVHEQVIHDMPWPAGAEKPSSFLPFVLFHLDSNNPVAADVVRNTASDTLWSVQFCAPNKQMSEIFSPEEREQILARLEELGLTANAKPLVEALSAP